MQAQKKDISTAKDYIKKGKNLDKAEALMTKLLKDSANRDNKKIWITLFEAQRKQYEQGNEKLYLKQKYDTAALFLSAKKMFATLESLDSIDVKPDRKGRVRPEYRKNSAEYLNTYRRNLYNGGIYFINKQKYQEAYQFFDMYIDCGNQPLFVKYNYNETDTLMPTAAYWAVYCGYKLKDTKATLHHTYLALKDKRHYQYMLQYLAETYKMEKDTTRYLQTLEEGFDKYPRFPFFFPRLMEYYSKDNQWEKLRTLCEKALREDSTSKVYRLAMSDVMLNTRHYDDCITLCRQLIREDSTFAGAYLNVGLAYFNKAVELDKKLRITRSERRQIQALYRKALPYLEAYRKMEPTRKNQWTLPLYTIYLNLNMGKEFDEIDKIMRTLK